MKIIQYDSVGYTDIFHPETEETERREILVQIEIPYSEENLTRAVEEAHDGVWTVVEKGGDTAPTTEERLTALEAALLEMMGVTLNG